MLRMHLPTVMTRVYARPQPVSRVTSITHPQMYRGYRFGLQFFFIASLIALQSYSTVLAVSDTDKLRFFETKVRPLLVAECFECHSADKAEGGLRLDNATTIRAGGDSGAAVVPGKPTQSLLVKAIRYEDLEMPPKAPLTESQQDTLVKWIRDGAIWPAGNHSRPAVKTETEKSWWAAQPLTPGTVPSEFGENRSRHPIDRYIDKSLNAVGLTRAETADRRHLIRRLSLDLLGLPPTPEQIEKFVEDPHPDAYNRLISRLFASPAYGERMARRWLDLVRFAESDGWRADAFRPQAWRYRQFVTDAFNEGMTYDQFVALQLAGDEIAPHDKTALAAVGLLRLGIYEFNQRDAEGQWQNIVDEITDVTADIFMATGLACAKCHDHKFDPIPRSDYFRFRSVFEPMLFVDQKPQGELEVGAHEKVQKLLHELAEVEAGDIQALADGAVDRFPLNVQDMFRKPASERTTYEHQIAYLVQRQVMDEGITTAKVTKAIGKERNEKREKILKQLSDLNANPYEVAELITVADADGMIRPTRLPGRTKGNSFQPGAPSVLGGQSFSEQRDSATKTSGRRTALAAWITSPENPISARVLVNRIWQYHFGTGLVESPNDFGLLGLPPSHPELLDYLAKSLIDSNWNIQQLQREIVSSKTYQQATQHAQYTKALEIDPENRLHWHRTIQRLDAEQYRDALLVAMGALQMQYGGPSVAGTPARRSIYLQRKRNSSDEMLNALDAPSGLVGTAKRDVTTTAPQALMMMNSPRVVNAAKSFANNVRGQVAHIEKAKRGSAFVNQAVEIISGMPANQQTIDLLAPLAARGQEGETDVCHILINSNSFLFIE
ncbi:MAG: hypothetical protein CMM01_11730 [Rhodopirellula sp.]|nr:hypothetical protein [Rhodopirellula sp.]OUX51217.1 MAG: hypothetical protein CBE43_04530 [Rhodopirellula sp. TMED283]